MALDRTAARPCANCEEIMVDNSLSAVCCELVSDSFMHCDFKVWHASSSSFESAMRPFRRR